MDGHPDPWQVLFDAAASDREPGANELVPYWIYELRGGVRVERRVPMFPFSREVGKLERLKRELAVYRLAFGQPRQEDLVAYLTRVGGAGKNGVMAQRISLEPPELAGSDPTREPVPPHPDTTRTIGSPDPRVLQWLGAEGEQLQTAFTLVFDNHYRPFGNPTVKIGGVSDGRDGVQWNVAYDPRDQRRWVGVNLEGMRYDDWPIARLLERELSRPTLLELVRRYSGLRDVILLLRRDYWQATSRPPIEARNIGPTPIALGSLTEDAWRAALEEALDCLDAGRGHRGRATQQVTLVSGKQVEGAVSPHLTFQYFALGSMSWEDLCREAKDRMAPLYEWATDRAKGSTT
jgi:hypothetical protein